MFTVDPTQAKGFDQVKPGEYEVTVVKYDQTTSQNGNPRIIVDYEIRSDVAQPHQGQQIRFDNFVVTENSMWRLHAYKSSLKNRHVCTLNTTEDCLRIFINRFYKLID
ncbi:DUF669 domain-containing protein [Bacillus cereus group sp. IBL03679]|uniref:DUF669 domain-containing protein n=1 Tax=Bacillus cereus group sp. IBL03679 TaxID=3240095 RepID=UPI003D2F8546